MSHLTVLTRAELEALLGLGPEERAAIEAVYPLISRRVGSMPPVVRVDVPEHHGEVDVKTAYLPGYDGIAIKVSAGFFDNPTLGLPSLGGLMVVLDARTGVPTAALFDAGWLTDHDVAIESAREDIDRLSSQARTPVLIAIDGELAGLAGIADPIKPGSAKAVAALRKQGLKVAMVSGDRQATAEAIAAELGIDIVMAEVLPEGKVEAVQQLRKAHGDVAFVGDGINDAPALAEAEVGLAIGTGTDIAIESADVVLMAGDLAKVPEALALSKATLRNIRQNLFWAFAYNTALIPVAAGLLYPVLGLLLSPMLAALAMALSSLFVVGNALRLKTLRLTG